MPQNKQNISSPTDQISNLTQKIEERAVACGTLNAQLGFCAAAFERTFAYAKTRARGGSIRAKWIELTHYAFGIMIAMKCTGACHELISQPARPASGHGTPDSSSCSVMPETLSH